MEEEVRYEWTQPKIKRFGEMYQSGVPSEVIMAEFGCTQLQLRNRVETSGFKRPAAKSFWTEDNVTKLRQYWADGLTASQAVVEFGGKITRSAIIGKADRLGLKKKTYVQIKAIPKPRPPRKAKPAKGPIVSVFGPMMSAVPKDPRPVRMQAWEPIPGVEPVSLMDRTGCCWIVTQDSPFLYCNHSVDEGSKLSYCSHHLDMYVSKERPARIRVKGLV